jgi:hypothetical protein
LKSDIGHLLSATEERSDELGVANHLPCALRIIFLKSDFGNLISAI